MNSVINFILPRYFNINLFHPVNEIIEFIIIISLRLFHNQYLIIFIFKDPMHRIFFFCFQKVYLNLKQKCFLKLQTKK